ncbi:S-adenosylmethionine--tRNA ribosyltransferase-isomerase [Planctomycetales bacterium 10988]|nr:S-adenosylmethionine--tRNA ribosyltransferase-isomerase [Planctomycetales bacterium 10988]
MSELSEYDYELPAELIAQHPLAEREEARLLVVHRRNASLEHTSIRQLPQLLEPEDCLIFNNTKVIPARIVGRRTETGGQWEGLFLQEFSDRRWLILSRTRGKLQSGETVTVENFEKDQSLTLQLDERGSAKGQWIVKPIKEHAKASAIELLEQFGQVPLPPYIRQGKMEPEDRSRYQTVFAKHPGAVAAPTAGLHFTEPLLQNLQEQGVTQCHVTLHVGLGTFRPVTVERLQDHRMHSEWGQISEETIATIKACKARGGRVISIGTTCVRVLETAALNGELAPWAGWTELFIRPPFTFNAIDGLLTNFHLPKSTLLVLTRSFGGDELIQKAYQEAIDQQYRFFSYGDAMLIL